MIIRPRHIAAAVTLLVEVPMRGMLCAMFLFAVLAGMPVSAIANDVCETCTISAVHQMKPPVPDMVCWTIRQNHPDDVVFRLGRFLPGDIIPTDPKERAAFVAQIADDPAHILYAPDKLHKGVNDKICVGRQRLKGVDWVFFCNTVRSIGGWDQQEKRRGSHKGEPVPLF